METTVLVTGATGNVGLEVIKCLQDGALAILVLFSSSCQSKC